MAESFRKVTLKTKDGATVGEAYLPPVKPMADVLFWGVRTFQRKDDTTYVEAFALRVVEGYGQGNR